MSNCKDCEIENKDNALMTPLMNSAATNNDLLFLYLYFKENCDLRNVDLNGNTLLHLAARSNSKSIANILLHIYQEELTGN